MTEKLLLFAAFVVSMLLMSINHKKKRIKVVFFGDSITEQGAGYGGYIRLLRNILQQESIDDDYELTGAGVPGDKIYDLYLRMVEDVLAKGADIVVIFIGINDVWHKWTSFTGTDIKQFEAFYIAIIEKLLSAGIKAVVCTPAVIGESVTFQTEEDIEIECYCNVIRSLAVNYELPIIDLRKAFINYNVANNIENRDRGVLTTDRVHLNSKGNQLVAGEVWRVLKHIK